MYFATSSQFLPRTFLTTTRTTTRTTTTTTTLKCSKRNFVSGATAAGTSSTTTSISAASNNNDNSATATKTTTATGTATLTTTARTLMEKFPIGFGTAYIDPIQEIPMAISSAIDIGYRRFDCAPIYFNEDAIGDELAKIVLQNDDNHQNNNSNNNNDNGSSNSSIRREDLYIVSKLASPFHKKEHVKIGLQKTLNDLRVDYLDLYLIHWPQAFYFDETMIPDDLTKRGYDNEDIGDSNNGKNIDPTVSIHETWEGMEELVRQGLVKSIGVSNFTVSLLHELMTKCQIPPSVNQVEVHPYLQQTKLINYCQRWGVHVQAYSPLGTTGFKQEHEPSLLQDPILQKIAKSHHVNVATICIVWALQRGTSIVVKSVTPERQQENFLASTLLSTTTATATTTNDHKIILSDEEMKQIATLERNYRFYRPEEWWGHWAMAVFD